MPARKLKPDDLRKVCDPSAFMFKTTEDFTFEREPEHQERGVKSIEFGLNVNSTGYNIFVCGSSGTGRNAQVSKAVNEIAARQKTPDDWVYVYNFIHEDEPIAMKLPAGSGKGFKKDIDEMITELRHTIPRAFESDDYEKRKHALLREYKQKRDSTLEEVEDDAFKEGFVLKQTATGVILVPRIKDRPMTPEEVEDMPDDEKEKIEKKKHELHIRIEQVLTEVRAMEKEVKISVKELEKEIALFSVKHIINEHRAKYKDFEDVVQHLNRVQEDIITNLDIFKDEEEASPNVLFGMKPMPKDDVFKKYQVNLLVDHSHSEGAPVIVEPNPTYYNLLGRIEYVAHFGAMTTDFTMIAPGSLHMANGGYLILQAVDVLTTFMAWDVLKKIIRNQQIKVEDINEQFRLITTTSLKPKPIPCNIKIILIGTPWVYHILFRYDDDFRKMFKVKADFDTEMERSVDKINKYAAFIKARCEDESLRHFDRKAVAAIVDYASRIAGDQEKLSARFMFIADMLRESNYWAAKDHTQYVNAQHVEKAIQEKMYRSSLIEEKISELIKENTLMINVEGERSGEINGLAVYDAGGYAFGKPTKITVATFMGKNGVIDIERQTKMGGDIHSKGILILSGFIGERFAQNYPLNLNASVCFEQSYDGVDGDSASSTEVYCLLSSLSGVPLKQYIAVTGSMNQHGVIQPIGGVNEKIEGFYHVCKVKGLDGRQGVMIPETNVRHLMLKEEVVKAVKAGKFHIWSVSSIDEGIEILTGRKAGAKNKKGEYPRGSINYLVAKKLKEYADKAASQARSSRKRPNKKAKGTTHEA